VASDGEQGPIGGVPQGQRINRGTNALFGLLQTVAEEAPQILKDYEQHVCAANIPGSGNHPGSRRQHSERHGDVQRSIGRNLERMMKVEIQPISDEVRAQLRAIVRLHGQIQRGRLQGRKNAESGHLAKIYKKSVASGRMKEIQSLGGKACRERGIAIFGLTPEQNRKNALMGGHEFSSEEASRGTKKRNHNFWHVTGGYAPRWGTWFPPRPNPKKCEFCWKARKKKESK
jgi:hypothetical protein